MKYEIRAYIIALVFNFPSGNFVRFILTPIKLD